MPPVRDAEGQVFAGASLHSLAHRFGTNSSGSLVTPDDEHAARRRALLGLIVAGAAALLLVLAVVIITWANGDDEGEPVERQDDGAVPVELSEVAEITAPATAPDSVDWAGNPVSYGTANLTDRDPATAWRMEGDATGQELTIAWDQPRTVSEVGLINGYAKVDPERENYDWYDINRQVMKVTWIFDDGTEVTQTLDETADIQTMPLDAPVETQSLRLRLDEMSDPGGRDYTALSEVTISGT